jgi:outer membrane protease
MPTATRFSTMLIIASFGYSTLASETNSTSLSLSAGMKQAEGELRYDIGSFRNSSTPISRLTWPMNIPMIAGEASISRSALEGQLQISRSLTENAGTIDDVDFANIDKQEAIRSESQAALTLWNADLSLLYWLPSQPKPSTWSLGAGAGYAYQHMSWEASDLHQWTPATPGIPDIHKAGLVATYEASLHMPYLQLAGQYRKPAWRLEGRLSYSPYLIIDDKDDHRLRGILSETWAEGHGFKAEIQGQWQLTGQWSLVAGASALDLFAEGSQRSHSYGSDISGVKWSENKKIWLSEVGAQLAFRYQRP